MVHDGLLVRLPGERALRMASTIRRTRAERLTSAPETSERMPPALPYALLPYALLPSASLPSTSLCVLRVSVFQSLPVLQQMNG